MPITTDSKLSMVPGRALVSFSCASRNLLQSSSSLALGDISYCLSKLQQPCLTFHVEPDGYGYILVFLITDDHKEIFSRTGGGERDDSFRHGLLGPIGIKVLVILERPQTRPSENVAVDITTTCFNRPSQFLTILKIELEVTPVLILFWFQSELFVHIPVLDR